MWVRFPPGTLLRGVGIFSRLQKWQSENGSENKSADFLIRSLLSANVSERGILLVAHGRTIWIADAHRGDEKRFVVQADEKLTAFMELEAAIWKSTVGPSARGLHFG